MKKELLEIEHEKFLADIPLLDCIYVIPTRRKHESGYKCMEVIGWNRDGYIKKLATYSDVFQIGEIFSNRHDYFHISMDIPECGVLRFFSHSFKFEVIHYGISTFQIALVKGGSNE